MTRKLFSYGSLVCMSVFLTACGGGGSGSSGSDGSGSGGGTGGTPPSTPASVLATIPADVAVADDECLAVNSTTNKIYVCSSNNTVTVIDGSANSATTTVPVGHDPRAMAVNSKTNKIYVANDGGTVTVIDGMTNSTTMVSAGSNPRAVAINAVTSRKPSSFILDSTIVRRHLRK